MAICVHYVVLIVALLITWILGAKTKPVSDIYENKIEKEFLLLNGNAILSAEEAIPSFSFSRPDRSTKNIIRPRTTRIGDNLFTARGYGKRSSKTEMALLSARSFGKRSKEIINSVLCIIIKCKNYSRILNINEDVVSFLEERKKKVPEQTAPDEDCC